MGKPSYFKVNLRYNPAIIKLGPINCGENHERRLNSGRVADPVLFLLTTSHDLIFELSADNNIRGGTSRLARQLGTKVVGEGVYVTPLLSPCV